MRPILVALFALLAAASGGVAAAQEAAPAPAGWTGALDLALVATSGNAESRTVGLSGTLRHDWADAALSFEAGAVDTEVTTRNRTAEQLPDGRVRVIEREDREQAVEKYFLRGRYDRALSAGWGWFAGVGWERNELGGLANRYTGFGGVSRLWFEREGDHLRTDAGLTWTREDLIAAPPGYDDSFAGIRLGWNYLNTLTPTTSLSSLLALDENLEETGDLRVDTTNAISVAISDRLALKVALQLLYDAEPAFAAVPVLLDGVPTGEVARVELDELDSVTTVALVLEF